jgi:hypothetical protein
MEYPGSGVYAAWETARHIEQRTNHQAFGNRDPKRSMIVYADIDSDCGITPTTKKSGYSWSVLP